MPATRFIDKLKKAANLEPSKRGAAQQRRRSRHVGHPMTASERERAKKDARSDDPGAFALQLLITKARDENGGRLFNPGDVSVLRTKSRLRLTESHAGGRRRRGGRATRHEKFCRMNQRKTTGYSSASE